MPAPATGECSAKPGRAGRGQPPCQVQRLQLQRHVGHPSAANRPFSPLLFQPSFLQSLAAQTLMASAYSTEFRPQSCCASSPRSIKTCVCPAQGPGASGPADLRVCVFQGKKPSTVFSSRRLALTGTGSGQNIDKVDACFVFEDIPLLSQSICVHRQTP